MGRRLMMDRRLIAEDAEPANPPPAEFLLRATSTRSLVLACRGDRYGSDHRRPHAH